MRLIDADALSMQIRKLTQPQEYFALDWMYNQAIAEAPTIDAVPVVHGRWMQRANGEVYCSHCNCTVGIGNLDEVTEEEYYCYNCGARMDGDK